MNGPALVITADDFGAAPAVNEAVEIAHRDGVLSAASLMVAGPAAADAVERARRLPDLRVGLHLVLTDGRPVLPAEQVRRLTGRDGRFSDRMAAAGARMFFDPRARRELAAEIDAQFAAFAATGLPLDHVNGHKHFQLHPTIARLIGEIGARYGLRAMRVPVEPLASLALADPAAPSRGDTVMSWWAKRSQRAVRRSGLLTPDWVFGLRWSGAMTAPRLAGLIRVLPPGLTEIYLHPATHGEFEGAVADYLYAEELAALTAPGAAAAVAERGARLGGFADFAA
ncbi:MAG TPA: hopanoid biosynthesis-associated protein HpnK [Caulobacteraceae bacterium]|nr:hopanoid biosynthesis-associated protein HpnK [Caulobacteraceae bacterium]